MEYVRKNRENGKEEIVSDSFVESKLTKDQYDCLYLYGTPQATTGYIYTRKTGL